MTPRVASATDAARHRARAALHAMGWPDERLPRCITAEEHAAQRLAQRIVQEARAWGDGDIAARAQRELEEWT